MKLEEGKRYMFNALKTIEMPGGSINLMLTGPDGKKYLLPLEYYQGYNLKVSGIIKCKVDKINCSGKVFLEPEHPFYREGESYDFEVGQISEYTDEKGVSCKKIAISDSFGNLASIPVEFLPSIPGEREKVHLRIDRISKGKLCFRSRTDEDELNKLIEGKSYEFTIVKIVQGPDEEQFYSAADLYGDVHLLQVRYYSHYGFEIGTIFRGKIVRYSSGHRKTIEPENPWFKPGDKMRVTVASCNPLETGDGFICEGFDNNGFSHTLVLPEKPEGDNLICRIIKIRKGRPVLERAEE
ncbi:MAG TPA: hypothetical protein VMV74_03575 [Bacteroidales bacterium]|nr:hypothetical protein [Bacteroidales bacterium]